MRRIDLLRVLIEPEEMSVDHILSLTRMTRRELLAELERRRAAVLYRSREKCPKGCKPGAPNCDLTHWIIPIDPIDTPFTEAMARVRSDHPVHNWINDPLTPSEGRERAVAIIAEPRFIEPLARAYRAIDAAFHVERKRWWEYIPYGLGWFVTDYKGVRVIWHYGYWTASSTLIIKVPERALTFILFANTDGLSAPYPLASGKLDASPWAREFLETFVIGGLLLP